MVTVSLRRALFKQPEVSIAIGLVLNKLILPALSTPLIAGKMGRPLLDLALTQALDSSDVSDKEMEDQGDY